MIALEEFAPTLDVASIYLETGDKQPEAIKFYSALATNASQPSPMRSTTTPKGSSS
jgi:hypothetical protein